MTNERRSKRDPVEPEIELALRPGVFVHDRACFSFVSDLEAVATRIAELTRTAPARAGALYETILAGCHEKAEEIDDSSGNFGQFVQGLFCGWIKARQAAGADCDATASTLLDWIADDPYGFCMRVEKDIAKALDTNGRAALEKEVRARFDVTATAAPSPDNPLSGDPGYLCRRWSEVLRAVYIEQRDVAAYVALADKTGLTAQDCHAIGALLASRRRSEQALIWVERGILIDGSAPYGSFAGHDLAKLRRELLTRLGRGREALQDAWAGFRKNPSKFTYDDLMRFVPKSERSSWHEKAMEATTGAHLGSLIELLLATRELGRLSDLLRRMDDATLKSESHYVTEPAAKKLETAHPDVAARLWLAQGMRIVHSRKSKYYAAAIKNFARAKRCYERAGLAAEWQKTVSAVRAAHHWKTGFMAGFKKLVAGSRAMDEPSFLDRARKRWGRPRVNTEL